MAIRFTLGAISSPFLAGLVDKLPHKRVMIGTDLIRAALVTAAAVCLWVDTPSWPIYVLATAASLLGTPFRIAQRAMLPSLVDRPEELTAANGTASTIESLSFFAGPAIAALLLGVTSIPVVFMVNVATFAWSMALVARLSPRPSARRAATDGDEKEQESSLRETAAGFPTIAQSRGLRLVTLAVAVQTFVAGVLPSSCSSWPTTSSEPAREEWVSSTRCSVSARSWVGSWPSPVPRAAGWATTSRWACCSGPCRSA